MKNLHLILSSVIIIPVALVYGIAHNRLLPILFSFDNNGTTDFHHILRAVMGLYLGMVVIWMMGILTPQYWGTATIVNMVFMAGLAFGRLISFVTDGMPSYALVIGFFVETMLAALSYRNWKKYKAR